MSLALFLATAQAAPPPNDNFAAAHVLVGETGTLSATNAEATAEPGEPAHADSAATHSIWYRWTPSFSGSAAVDTCPSEFDTVLAVYTGTAVNALTRVAEDDDSCAGTQSRVRFQVNAGTTYSIAVDGFEGSVGTIVLQWRRLVPPPNDAFAAAQPLSGTTGRIEGTNEGATLEPGEPAHGSSVAAASVWYTWTPPISGVASIDTCQSEFDSTLGVYTGDAIDRLTQLGASDDDCGIGGARVRLTVSAGTTLRIAVAGSDGDSGTITLAWIVAVRPANDNFSRARRITGMRGSLTQTNVAALAEPGEPRHARISAAASLWYRWRAPRTTAISFDTCATDFDTILAVYRGRSLRRLVTVDSNDDGCENGSRLAFFARRGTTYRIAVDGYGGRTGTFMLRWGPPNASVTRCVVPDVRGLLLRAASRALEAADCRLGAVRRVQSFTVPRGRVVSQNPQPGRRRPFGARVQLDVSRGRG